MRATAERSSHNLDVAGTAVRCCLRTDAATPLPTAVNTRASRKAGVNAPFTSVALVAKLASDAAACRRGRVGAPYPRVRGVSHRPLLSISLRRKQGFPFPPISAAARPCGLPLFDRGAERTPSYKAP